MHYCTSHEQNTQKTGRNRQNRQRQARGRRQEAAQEARGALAYFIVHVRAESSDSRRHQARDSTRQAGIEVEGRQAAGRRAS